MRSSTRTLNRLMLQILIFMKCTGKICLRSVSEYYSWFEYYAHKIKQKILVA
jgi:hypothetical protein